jgi:hypothetical protein
MATETTPIQLNFGAGILVTNGSNFLVTEFVYPGLFPNVSYPTFFSIVAKFGTGSGTVRFSASVINVTKGSKVLARIPTTGQTSDVTSTVMTFTNTVQLTENIDPGDILSLVVSASSSSSARVRIMSFYMK